MVAFRCSLIFFKEVKVARTLEDVAREEAEEKAKKAAAEKAAAEKGA